MEENISYTNNLPTVMIVGTVGSVLKVGERPKVGPVVRSSSGACVPDCQQRLQRAIADLGSRRGRLILSTLYLFSYFLSDLDLNTDNLGYKYRFGFLRLRIRIDVYRIRSEPDANHVGHRCLLGYRVTAIFIQNKMSNYC